MNILAFDPGTEIIGISYLSGPSGNIIKWIKELKLKGSLNERYASASLQVADIVSHTNPIDYIALETPYMGRNPAAAIKLGTVRGLILSSGLKAIQADNCVDVAPQEIRRVFDLPIKSTKEEYHKVIKKHYGDKLFEEVKEDGMDAVAVGLTAATKIRKDLWWKQNG